jgi:hypothetical protein
METRTKQERNLGRLGLVDQFTVYTENGKPKKVNVKERKKKK